MGDLLVDPLGTLRRWLAGVGWWLLDHAVAGLAVGLGVLVVVLAARWLARRVSARVAASAVWWEVVAPARLPASGGLPLWQLLLALMQSRGGPGRVSAEFFADGHGQVRAGLWAPGTVEPSRIRKAVSMAWPGADVQPGQAPRSLPAPVLGRELVPRHGQWAPLVDPAPRWTRVPASVRVAGEEEDEPLGPALGALREAECPAAVQVVVSPWAGGGGGSRWRAVWRWVSPWLRKGVLAVLNGIVKSPPPKTVPGQAPATLAQARVRQALDKHANGPHLRVTVRVAAGGGSESLRLSVLAPLADAMSVAVPGQLRPRGQRRIGRRVWERRHGASFPATAAELAALWHLPAHPGAYGLPDPGLRQRRPSRHLRLLPPAAASAPPAAWPRSGPPRGRGDSEPDTCPLPVIREPVIGDWSGRAPQEWGLRPSGRRRWAARRTGPSQQAPQIRDYWSDDHYPDGGGWHGSA